MNGAFLLVSIGCGQLPEIFAVSEKHGFAVFGTLDGQALVQFLVQPGPSQETALTVYFYESG